MLGLRHYKGVAIDLWLGDITTFVCDAMVNAANSELTGGGGVDGAIHRTAGPQLMEACQTVSPCPPGETRVTPAFNLPCDHVIHTVGPIYQDGNKGEEEILGNCYRSSLNEAGERKLRHIAFSAISNGAYGFPLAKASTVAMNVVRASIDESTSENLPTRITFVLFSDEAYDSFQKALFATFEEEST